MCSHVPRCPAAAGPQAEAARVAAAHPEQGWSLLCNGVVLFDDTGLLLPDGRALPPSREVPPPYRTGDPAYRAGSGLRRPPGTRHAA